MANEPERSATDKPEPLHCAEIVNPPNRYRVRSSVHLCIVLDHATGDAVRSVSVHLDMCCLPDQLAEEFRRDPDARSRVEAEIARSAASEFMRRDRGVIWRGERLD